jgi:hypothetical protein
MTSSFRQIEKKRMVKITELRSESVLKEAFPILRELHHQLDEQRYTELLAEMMPNGYRLFALRDGGRIAAVAGVQILTILYCGRHLYVYDSCRRQACARRGRGKASGACGRVRSPRGVWFRRPGLWKGAHRGATLLRGSHRGKRDHVTPSGRPYADAFSSGLGLQHPEACRSCSRWRLACWFERLSGVLIVQEDT